MSEMLTPSFGERARFGLLVLDRAAGVLWSRLQSQMRSSAAVPANVMFGQSLVDALEPERRRIQSFDLYLFDVMNAKRLKNQIVFEYATLVRSVGAWRGLRVLDVGTGRSTFPRWLSREGAVVTTFDLPAPAEVRAGGFLKRVDGAIARRPGAMHAVAGSMLKLPFPDGTFDVVTSLSVVEHLDTDFPSRAYVPYDEQQRRLGEVLDEMARVTRSGGLVYLTSECCDYDRATTDQWRRAYYYDRGPALSAAWPVHDVPRLFYDYLRTRSCELVGGLQFDPNEIDRPDRWSFRGPFFSGFSVLARKR